MSVDAGGKHWRGDDDGASGTRYEIRIGLLLTTASGHAIAATSCEDVAKSALRNVQVTAATRVAPGAFKPPSGIGGGPNNTNVYAALPEFCRVEATLKPSADSEIIPTITTRISGSAIPRRSSTGRSAPSTRRW